MKLWPTLSGPYRIISMKQTKKRCFIALLFEDTIKQHLRHIQEDCKKQLSNARWTQVENLHLTLAFLGDVVSNEVHAVQQQLETLCRQSEPFTLQSDALRFFPDATQPSVFVLECQSSPPLQTLTTKIQSACQAYIHHHNTHRFRPHITLARMKQASALALPSSDIDFKMKIEAVYLMQSEIRQTGAEYTILSAHTLGEKKPAA